MDKTGITQEEKIKLIVSNANKSLAKLKEQKLKINSEITLQEDVLRNVRQECNHPKEFVENTSMNKFKKCTVCEDLLFRP